MFGSKVWRPRDTVTRTMRLAQGCQIVVYAIAASIVEASFSASSPRRDSQSGHTKHH